MKSSIFFALTLVSLVTVSVATADDYDTYDGHYNSSHYDSNGYYPYYYHSSTAYEGALRGKADFVRAAGEFNLNTSRALVNVEEARRRAIENKRSEVETYFDLKRINKQYQDEVRRPAPTAEQIQRIAAQRTASRTELDEVSPLGDINWPDTLRAPMFNETRESIDQLFQERTLTNSGLGSDNYREIKVITNEMENILKQYINDLPSSDYIFAKKFLSNLAYEARFAPSPVGVAAR